MKKDERPSARSGRTGAGGGPRRRYVRFTRWRRARFFRVLGETGHVQMAAEAAGVSYHTIYRLRRVEAGFAGRMDAAREEAALRLASSPGSAADERVHEREGSRGHGSREEEAGSRIESGMTVAGMGDGLFVVRRGIGGRLRVVAAGRWWTDAHDAVFLGHLRATGNVRAAAAAAGFTPKTAYNRRSRLPSFARAWERELIEAEWRLEARVVAEALRGTPAMYPGAFEAGEPERLDPWLALNYLKWRERRRR